MAENMPLTSEIFANIMSDLALDSSKRSAVGVSGGSDSMALCKLLSLWAEKNGAEIHALIVDHGLRSESAQEVDETFAALSGMPNVIPHILKWEGQKPEAALQEEARKARYALMAEYCAAHDIAHLFLAHHRDDQAETFLFRLAKGSGLDGLCGMRACQPLGETLTLCRPLLGVSKEELINFCECNGVSYIQDPSNENPDFARVRLRKSRAVLEEEGLSAKRLSVTAKRLSRAKNALEAISEDVYEQATKESNTQQIVFNYKVLAEQPEEIMLRCLLRALGNLRPEADYAPRMERVEVLLDDLRNAPSFRKRTLGGVIFERDDKAGTLILSKE